MSASEMRRTIIDLERRLEREQVQQDALRRVALRALAVVGARVPALDGAVQGLSRAVEACPPDSAWMDRLGAQLADAVRSSDHHEDLASAVLEVVRRGLNGFDFLDPGLDDLHRATERRDRSEIERTLSRLFLVLHDKCERAMHERDELSDVVGEIWHRLEDVDSALSEDEKRSERARDSVASLHAGISDNVQAMKGRMDDLEDIGTLRQEISRGLDRVVEHVAAFRNQQESDLLEALERNRLLRAKGRTLESQINALRKRLDQARAEAYRDSLTGLPNRTAFERYLDGLREELGAEQPACLLVWDIDRFKAINDEYGHSAGDKVLKAVAEILAEGVHSEDFVARYGGEEFVMILTADPDTCQRRADSIREAVDRLIVRAGKTRLRVTISAGMCPIVAGQSTEAIFDAADHALLQAKKLGRDRVERADREPHPS
ncbi:GGDEF domain-containing protein [Thioalkalivibrio sp. HL-Eb18]|uniref:sensor domain-containing diguanylate cyclase n=1 Tax=Thioalkalivibrio sp. HL-Eb18 TaxID=1266913 RepID=UPI0003655799|nr:GGDEF domain-containing protein [Thioalkalivibrio sp. HL-Eb18]